MPASPAFLFPRIEADGFGEPPWFSKNEKTPFALVLPRREQGFLNFAKGEG